MNYKNKKQFKRGKVGEHFRTIKLNNENLHKKNRKELTKIIILAAFLLISVIGISYALFLFSMDSKKETEIVAGTFKVEFEEGKEIHMSNLAPMSDSEGMATNGYHFTIKNTGDVNAKYHISLEEMGMNEKTLDKKYIRYSIKLGDSNWSEARYLSDNLLLDSGSLSAESGRDKIDYELKMWLTEDADNSVQGKTFAARIVVSAVQDNEKVPDIIDSKTPLIVLNGESNITIEQGTFYIEAGVSKIVDDKDKIPTSSINMTYYFLNNGQLEQVDRIDTTRLGTYYIYYKVTDSDGNTGTIVRNVHVV